MVERAPECPTTGGLTMKMLLATVSTLALLAAAPANAVPIITFGQTSLGDTVTAIATPGSTTLTAATPVTITEISGNLAVLPATFTLNATSQGPALAGAF